MERTINDVRHAEAFVRCQHQKHGKRRMPGDAGGLKTFDGVYGKFDIQMASNLWIRYPTLTVTCMLTRGMVRWIMVEHDGISD